jgi:hypothetical protein
MFCRNAERRVSDDTDLRFQSVFTVKTDPKHCLGKTSDKKTGIFEGQNDPRRWQPGWMPTRLKMGQEAMLIPNQFGNNCRLNKQQHCDCPVATMATSREDSLLCA